MSSTSPTEPTITDAVRKAANEYCQARHLELVKDLGVGGSRSAFAVKDNRRQTEVVLRVYHETLTETYLDRDWYLTSTLRHPNIAETFSVENFRSSDGQIHTVVLARFIPGKSLDKILDLFPAKSYSDPVAIGVLDQLFDDIAPDLCGAVEFLHKLSISHADIGPVNVVVTEAHNLFLDAYRGTFLPERVVAPVLIDFDNVDENRQQFDNESEMRYDLNALKSLLCRLTAQSPWARQLHDIINKCSTVNHLHAAVDLLVRALGMVSRPIEQLFTTDLLVEVLKRVSLLVLGAGEPGNLMLQLLRDVVSALGVQRNWDAAIAQLTHPGQPNSEFDASVWLDQEGVDPVTTRLLDVLRA